MTGKGITISNSAVTILFSLLMSAFIAYGGFVKAQGTGVQNKEDIGKFEVAFQESQEKFVQMQIDVGILIGQAEDAKVERKEIKDFLIENIDILRGRRQ